jgi:hypothetical protein
VADLKCYQGALLPIGKARKARHDPSDWAFIGHSVPMVAVGDTVALPIGKARIAPWTALSGSLLLAVDPFR